VKAHIASDKHHSKYKKDNVLWTDQQTVRPVQAALEQPNYSPAYHRAASVKGNMCYCHY